MQKRIFSNWLRTFRKSINGYKYYNDFEKAVKNTQNFEYELRLLDCLLTAKNIEKKFEDIINKYPECLKAIPIIITIGNYEIYCQDENEALTYRFDERVQIRERNF